LVSSLRGDPAWQQIKSANQFNSAPEPGYEYILGRVRIEYLKGKTDDLAYRPNQFDFTAVSTDGKDYDDKFAVAPNPKLSGQMYSGSSTEGYIVLYVTTYDQTPLLTFGRKYDGTGGAWWKLFN